MRDGSLTEKTPNIPPPLVKIMVMAPIFVSFSRDYQAQRNAQTSLNQTDLT